MNSDIIPNFGYTVQIGKDTINAFNITKKMLINQFGEDRLCDQEQTVAEMLEELAISSEDLKLTVGDKEIKVCLYYHGKACSVYDELNEG